MLCSVALPAFSLKETGSVDLQESRGQKKGEAVLGLYCLRLE